MVNPIRYATKVHALFLAAVTIHSINAAEVFIIGDNGARGNSTNHLVQSVSGDGSVVAVSQSTNGEALAWTVESGLVELSSIAGPAFAAHSMNVSDDGQIVSGQLTATDDFVDKAFRWTRANGLEILGLPPSFSHAGAWGMSSDGSVLSIADVGGLTDNPIYRWTPTDGFASLGLPDGYLTGRPRHVSADGNTIVGSLVRNDGVTEGFLWSESGGWDTFGTLPGWNRSGALDVSSDGSIVVGSLCDTDGQPHCGGRPHAAFRRTKSEGLVEIPALEEGLGNEAYVVSRDGTTVLGNSLSNSGMVQGQDAFVWDRYNGTRKLENVLRDEHGVALPDSLPLLTRVFDLSADARVLIGNTVISNSGFGVQWAIYLDRPLVVTTGVVGDFNGNAELGVKDLDLLAKELQSDRNVAPFDVNSDTVVDFEDRRHWVHSLANTYFGDSNLDGEFNTKDLVAIFEAGEYEDDVPLNSTWATGDWNGDGEFSTSDLVAAFEDSGYEQGPRTAVQAVPEPNGFALLAIGLCGLARFGRRRIKLDSTLDLRDFAMESLTSNKLTVDLLNPIRRLA